LFDIGLRSNLVIVLEDKELSFNEIVFKKNIFFIVSRKKRDSILNEHYVINNFKDKWDFGNFQEEFIFFLFLQFFLYKNILLDFYNSYKNRYFHNKDISNNVNYFLSVNYLTLNNSSFIRSKNYWLFISYKLNVLLNSLDSQLLNRFIRLRRINFNKRRNRACLNPFFIKNTVLLKKGSYGSTFFSGGFFAFMPRSFRFNIPKFEKQVFRSPDYINIFRNLNLVLVLLWNYLETFNLRDLFFRGFKN